MLEAARESLDMPLYHSPNLTATGREFADAVQSSFEVVEDDLGTDTGVNVSEKATAVKSRLTKSDA
jgi:hypothetical protein